MQATLPYLSSAQLAFYKKIKVRYREGGEEGKNREGRKAFVGQFISV